MKKLLEGFSWKQLGMIAVGAAVLSFGLYNVHHQSDITEGGVLGLLLFADHWFGISPAILTPLLDGACYLLAFKYLGFAFIKISAVSTVSVSVFYKIWEMFPPLLPDLSDNLLAASILGGLFVGVGVGIIVRQGGSSGGDDALALAISKKMHCKISKAYLFTDFTVLALSLSYIPLRQILFSVLTVTLSSNLIDLIQNMTLPTAKQMEEMQ